MTRLAAMFPEKRAKDKMLRSRCDPHMMRKVLDQFDGQFFYLNLPKSSGKTGPTLCYVELLVLRGDWKDMTE